MIQLHVDIHKAQWRNQGWACARPTPSCPQKSDQLTLIEQSNIIVCLPNGTSYVTDKHIKLVETTYQDYTAICMELLHVMNMAGFHRANQNLIN